MASGTRVLAKQLSADVARLVTEDVLGGATLADPSDFVSEAVGVMVDLHGLGRLQEEAISRYGPGDLECDSWLAPRLHCLLRLTRRQAHNQGLWRWLALQPLAPYVRHRWAKGGKVTADRYLGTGYKRRNAIARLWWASELTRNGPDYRSVAEVLGQSALDQYMLDERYGDLRASVLAMLRVCTGKEAGVRKMRFDEIKQLSKRVNLLLSATALESLAQPQDDELGAVDSGWIADVPEPEVIIQQKLEDLVGPSDGKVSDEEIEQFARWYAEVAEQVIGA